MHQSPRPPSRLVVTIALLAIAHCTPLPCAGAEGPKNLFANPGFELGRLGPWRLEKGGKTSAGLSVDAQDAFEGRRSALVNIDSIDEGGVRFGQSFEAGEKGKTYTFAIFAKALGGSVTVDLQVERAAKNWWDHIKRPVKPEDLVVKSKAFKLGADKWTELHVTFKVAGDFPQGWFAYINCTQPKSRYRADMFRLYEGRYTPLDKMAKKEAPRPDVRLFDTTNPSPLAISSGAVSGKNAWTSVPEGTLTHAFRGDTVFLNDRIALVLRHKGRGAELYARGPTGMKFRAILSPAQKVTKLARVRITKNDPSEVAVNATFDAPGGKGVTIAYRLKMGQAFIETEPLAGVTALRVKAPCRFAVLPDFFADDIVTDATCLPGARADLPSEHFLLHMLGQGEAIVMSVWNVAERDVRVALSGKGDKRVIESSDIFYGKKGKVWVAVLEGPDIWHERQIVRGDAGRIINLAWRAPYPALWRVDWTRENKLTGSWEMINQRSDGRFDKHTWFGKSSVLGSNRKRWLTVLGHHQYPCWIDISGRGHLQPFKKTIRFEGPVLIYPVDRVRKTPLDRFAVVDIMRRTLGVGPCEYILDVENQRSRYKGRATCMTRNALDKIYSRKEQKRRKAETEKILAEMMVFIHHIRGRIERYVTFGHKLLDYLAREKKAHRELAGRISELETLTRAIDAYVDKRRRDIKTPDHVAKMVREFRETLLTYEGPDAPARVKKFTHAWVKIGGAQDELVAECRMAVKWVRQRAGLMMASEPRMAEISREIRLRTQKILRNPASHEGANH